MTHEQGVSWTGGFLIAVRDPVPFPTGGACCSRHLGPIGTGLPGKCDQLSVVKCSRVHGLSVLTWTFYLWAGCLYYFLNLRTISLILQHNILEKLLAFINDLQVIFNQLVILITQTPAKPSKDSLIHVWVIVITYLWKEEYPQCASLTWGLTLWNEMLRSYRESCIRV